LLTRFRENFNRIIIILTEIQQAGWGRFLKVKMINWCSVAYNLRSCHCEARRAVAISCLRKIERLLRFARNDIHQSNCDRALRILLFSTFSYCPKTRGPIPNWYRPRINTNPVSFCLSLRVCQRRTRQSQTLRALYQPRNFIYRLNHSLRR